MTSDDQIFETVPVGTLGIIPLDSCKDLGEKINDYLVKWRREREHEHKETIYFRNYEKDSYIVGARVPRFGTGEAKGALMESVRGYDLYIMVDVCNYSLS